MMTPRTPTTTRVERHTAPHLNERVRRQTEAEVIRLEGAPEADITARLGELEREWDVERVLQTNASVLAMTGLLLARRVDRRFLLLPAAVFTFLLQHAVQGWCPPIPILRRLGVRTAREIAREKYALKVLRGDFDRVPAPSQAGSLARVRAALDAVDA